MDAKQLQVVLTVLCGIGLAVVVGDVLLALARPGLRRQLRWRVPAVAMVACGVLVFAGMAWAGSLAQPTLDELLNTADQGYSWFPLVPAALLATIALLAAVRPRDAVVVLVLLAIVPVLGLAVLAASVILGAKPSEGAPVAIVVSFMLVSLPAAVTAIVLRSALETGSIASEARAPAGRGPDGATGDADRRRARTERLSAAVVAGVMVLLVALAGGFLFGAPRNAVTFHTGTATSTDTEITLTADGTTTTIPADGVRWVLKREGEWAVWSEPGRPSCLPPGQRPLPITFASLDVNADVRQWRQVVLLVCLERK